MSYNREYYLKNKEKYLASTKKYIAKKKAENEKEFLAKQAAYQKEYYRNNHDKRKAKNEYDKKWRKNHPDYFKDYRRKKQLEKEQ